ncbi:DUF5691 domain-containing protein [Agitococcus lubricus]|uniref:Uncharacterized protein n=1 Tax=Agitococcus lubricus TaxID=1077255 RepID=A0A2T5J3W1_9GAMM|nr:DUF5691 domain-containing protein [Agitococcus lubricus]PTQ91300.1 hypothetical protein C8N29_101373 [Agitococcus lubricus]
MKTWQSLQVAALLGTQKPQAPLHWPDNSLQQLADQLPQEPPILLNQLALMSVYVRAGHSPVPCSVQDLAPEDSLAIANTAQQKHLSYVLSPEGQDYLSTWLTYAQGARVRCPHRYLAQLLELGTKHKKWRIGIAQVVGARGAWLAQQQAEWAWLRGGQICLSDPQLLTEWHTASTASRELLFERLRQAQPAQALAFLAQIYAEESANTRKSLLEKLAIHLSSADHDFLEGCLDDRSKVVKEVVVDLLARLPNSALQQRLQTCLSTHLLLKKGMMHKALVIEAIESVSASLERDGLNPKAADIKNGLGEKAQWLRDVLAGVSLTWLSIHYEMDGEQFLAASMKTDWAEAIVTGLATAAIRQQQEDWLKALLAVQSKKFQLNKFQLFNALTPPHKEHYLLKQLALSKKTSEQANTVMQFFYHSDGWLWSSYFTQVVMGIYQEQIKEQQHSQLHVYLARFGDWQLSKQINDYPSPILHAWQIRMEMAQAFV